MYVGLDVHKRFNQATVVDKDGVVLCECTVQNKDKQLDRFLQTLAPGTKLALEACSVWEPIYDFIESKGLDVCLIHPRKTRLIAESRSKTDRNDATMIAQLLRVNMVYRSYVPCKDVRKLRFLVRHRKSLRNQTKQVKNKVHAILAREGITHELSDLFGKRGMLILENIPLRSENRFAVNQLLDLLKVIRQEIAETDEYIALRSHGINEVELLKTVPGISTYSAAVIYSEIADIKRFPKWKKLCAYAGIVSSVYQSADTKRFGPITKEGSRMLRWILVQCVQHTVRKPNGVQKTYMRILKKKGHKKAIVASARKLLVYIYIMLTQGITFQALRVNSA